jgi:ubiquinone biosynthesis protein
MKRILPSRRTRRRLLAINSVVTRRGLNWVADEIRFRRLFRRHSAAPSRTELTAVSLRKTLEDLGTTFIKFGQVLSTRPDLVPAEYIHELSKLQDKVPPLPYEVMERVFIEEIGAKPQDYFLTFNTVPRASASIGQVYDAVMLDGLRVVVKIQRPGLKERCAEDIGVLRGIANFLAHSSVGDRIDLVGAVEEFSVSLFRELDFGVEARNASQIRDNFKNDPAVKIPLIFPELSSQRILTEELIEGIRIDDLDTLDQQGFDRHALAQRCCYIALTQIFEHRFFHADPHPGNFFVLQDGTVAMIDFGMVGRIDSKTRDTLAKLVPAISNSDADELGESLLELGVVKLKVDRHRLTRDLQRLIDEYSGKKLGEISLGNIAGTLVDVMRRNGLQLPSNLILLIRVLSIDEGMARKLDPTFQLTEYAAPFFKKFWLEQLSPVNIAKQQVKNTLELLLASKDGIRRIARVLSSIERGDFSINTNMSFVEGPIEELRIVARSVTRAILISALLITGGLIFVALHLK